MATQVFAATGFRAATVRDICARAGVNLAAVNYHFGGKEDLYIEVLRRNCRRALEHFPPDGGTAPNAPAEERFRGFIRSFLGGILADEMGACDGRLLAREMLEPTPALDALVAVEVQALTDRLAEILRELLPPDQDVRTVRLCLASVVSQIVFFHHCRPVLSRMFPELRMNATGLQEIADHIARFSLAALHQLGPGHGAVGPPRRPTRSGSPARSRRTPPPSPPKTKP